MGRIEVTLLLAFFACSADAWAQKDRPAAQFEVVDGDKDGFIDREEFDRARSAYEIRSSFEQLDADKDGKISQQEAIRAYEYREIDRSVKEALSTVDTDKDGSISPAEFRNSDMGKRNPGAYKTIDTDGDGELSAAELRRAVIKRRGASMTLKEPRPGFGDQPDLVAPSPTPLPEGMPPPLLRNQPYDSLPGVDPRLLALDVYDAKGDGPHPILVMVHGGAWSAGDKTGRGVIAPKAAWLSEIGVIFASVNYRLSPAVSHPDHANDVAQAIGWLTEHATEFNGDPDRIFLMGHSAGAHIVAAVATDPRHLERAGLAPTVIKGTIPLDVGAYDMSLRSDLSPGARKMYESAFGTQLEGRIDPWTEASPITHVRGAEAAERIAPFLLVTSSQPRRRIGNANTHVFAKALLDEGISVEVIEVDKTHGECNSHVGVRGDPLTIAIGAFLENRLSALQRVPAPTE